MRLIILSSIALSLTLSFSGCKKAQDAAGAVADTAKAGAGAVADTAKAAGGAVVDGAKAAGGAVANGAAAVKDAVAGSTKDAYVAAAVKIACAIKGEKDPAAKASKTAEIQKTLGFDADSWKKMAMEVAKDTEATKKIATGISTCK